MPLAEPLLGGPARPALEVAVHAVDGEAAVGRGHGLHVVDAPGGEQGAVDDHRGVEREPEPVGALVGVAAVVEVGVGGDALDAVDPAGLRAGCRKRERFELTGVL